MESEQIVLVTGAGGFVGSHLVEALLSEGRSVRAMVSYRSNGDSGWLRDLPPVANGRLEIVRADIRDTVSVRAAMDKCSIVFHLASLVSIPHSYEAPATYVQTNVQGTLNLLQAASEANVERFLHVSSSEVYGTAVEVPMTEQHPLAARSPYAATKIAGEQMALAYYRSFGLPVTVVRPFNMFGPRQSARAIVPTLILQLLNGDGELALGAIHPTRDFTYVKDSVRAFLELARSSDTVGEIYNVCRGEELSVENVALLLGQLLGKSVRFAIDSRRLRPITSEVDRHCGSHSKLSQTVDWKPVCTGDKGLRSVLMETIDWYSNPRNQNAFLPAEYQK